MPPAKSMAAPARRSQFARVCSQTQKIGQIQWFKEPGYTIPVNA